MYLEFWKRLHVRQWIELHIIHEFVHRVELIAKKQKQPILTYGPVYKWVPGVPIDNNDIYIIEKVSVETYCDINVADDMSFSDEENEMDDSFNEYPEIEDQDMQPFVTDADTNNDGIEDDDEVRIGDDSVSGIDDHINEQETDDEQNVIIIQHSGDESEPVIDEESDNEERSETNGIALSCNEEGSTTDEVQVDENVETNHSRHNLMSARHRHYSRHVGKVNSDKDYVLNQVCRK